MVTRTRRRCTRAGALVAITVLGAALYGLAGGDGAGAVGPNPVTVTITSSANPSVNGQTVTFTATVTGSAGVPTGKVTPYKNGSAHSSVTLDAQGRASWSSTFSPGTTTASATYQGNSVYAVGSSPTITQTTNPAASTTVVTSSANPSIVGASVTLTATNTGVAPGTCSIDSGTVNFYDGLAKIGSKSASSGKAAFSIKTLARGPHSITAVFPSTSKCVGSTSAAMTQTVAARPTTTTLTSSPNPSAAGQSVTFTATVTSSSGTPTGTVTFTDGATALGSAPLASGQASIPVTTLTAGSHSIVASYAGANDDAASTSTARVQTVTGSATTTTVGSSSNPSAAGQSVTFTATVTSGAGAPTGTVTFTDGPTALGTGSLTSGQATLTTSALGVGAHSVTATYNGDTTFTGSTSPTLTQTVNASVTDQLFVDRANPSCTNSGTGTAAAPFCTIGAAASKATAGRTVVVASGTYNEKVTVTTSGTAGAPVTFTTAPGATVTLSGGSNGFSISGRSWVVVHGFTVTGTTGVGITVSTSNNITIDGNHVSNAGVPVSGSTATGIKLNATTQSTVSGNTTDHNTDAGVYLTTDANNNTIRNNASFANARGYVRAAAGFDLRNSTGNLVYGNVAHDNEDSGINVWTGTTWGSNLVYDNVTYANGDHGIDVHNAVDARIVANTVYRNYDSGIEMTTSTNSLLANNVSIDNGMNSVRTSGNIRADSASVSGGSTVNDDLVNLSVPGVMVDWGGVKYSSLAAFRTATGQESRGVEGDPRFRNASGADFHLLAGSPAIDAANTSIAAQPTVDFDGTARVDDPATTDTGTGPVTFADRGAFEYRP